MWGPGKKNKKKKKKITTTPRKKELQNKNQKTPGV